MCVYIYTYICIYIFIYMYTHRYFSSRELYVLRHAGDGIMGHKILTGFPLST